MLGRFVPGKLNPLGRAVVVAPELKEPRVEADGVALALEHGALQGGNGPRTATQGSEGVDVPAQEALERFVQREERVQCPRPAQHQHERGEGAHGPADPDPPEAPPIALALLRWQQREPEVGLRPRCGPERRDHAAELYDGARVAPRAHHLEQPRGTWASAQWRNRPRRPQPAYQGTGAG